MARRNYALHANAIFGGRCVAETFARSGHAVQIGNSDALPVPVPEGKPYVARVQWTGRDSAIVLDAEGRQHLLDPDEHVKIRAGEVELELTLVPQFRHARGGVFSWRMSLGFFVVVLAVSTGVESLTVSESVYLHYRCDLLHKFAPERALRDPECNPSASGGGVTAEYLARLLEEDYAGTDDGVIAPSEREDHEKKNDSFYLPAGDQGPTDEMGGSAETAPQPIRGQEDSPEPPPAIEAPAEDVTASEQGEPVADPQEEQLTDDAIADGMGDDPDDTDSAEGDAPAEEKKGWGVRDWYDAKDERIENLEIELMLQYAKERLRIDPNSPEALSILSYYQYLAQDFPKALATYDKIIELYPDESAGYNNKALVHKRLGQYEEEEALYRVALSLEPEDVTALNNLAVNLAHQKRYDEAQAVMKRLEILDPGDPYADLHRAKIYADMGEVERAYEFLEKALSGMAELDTLHHIEFRQDIRVDPSFDAIRETPRFRSIMVRYYGDDTPVPE